MAAVAFLAGLVAGAAAMRVFPGPGPGGVEGGETGEQFRLRTEEYQPSCEALRASGSHPVVVRRGDDLYLTVSRDSYYYVVGIYLPPGRPPEFSWWGAALDSALNDCRP